MRPAPCRALPAARARRWLALRLQRGMAGVMLLAACCGTTWAQNQVPEYQLKAAYIFNFAVFAEWPAEALPSGAPLQLCVFGGNPLLDALQALADKTVNGRKLAVRALPGNTNGGTARGCQLLVLERGDRERWPQLRRELGNASVLTIADDKQIASAGAMLALFKEDHRIVFDADLGAARACHLGISSKLLRLARSVQ